MNDRRVVVQTGNMSSVAVSVASLGNGFLPRRRSMGARGPTRARLAPAMLTSRRTGIASGTCSWIDPRGVTRKMGLGRVARLVVRASAAPEPQDRAVRKTAGESGDDPITGSLHQARGLRERLASVVDAFKPNPNASQNENAPDEEWERWHARFERVDNEEGILVALQVSLVSRNGKKQEDSRRPRNPTKTQLDAMLPFETNPLTPTFTFHPHLTTTGSARRRRRQGGLHRRRVNQKDDLFNLRGRSSRRGGTRVQSRGGERGLRRRRRVP